jgi:WD40 repeat protein
LAVIDSTSTLQLWETTNWNPTHQIPLPELDALRAIDFSPDSRFLALGGKNGRVVLWNLEANTITELVDGLPQPLVDLQFNPTADALLACYQDGTLRLWLQQP